MNCSPEECCCCGPVDPAEASSWGPLEQALCWPCDVLCGDGAYDHDPGRPRMPS